MLRESQGGQDECAVQMQGSKHREMPLGVPRYQTDEAQDFAKDSWVSMSSSHHQRPGQEGRAQGHLCRKLCDSSDIVGQPSPRKPWTGRQWVLRAAATEGMVWDLHSCGDVGWTGRYNSSCFTTDLAKLGNKMPFIF